MRAVSRLGTEMVMRQPVTMLGKNYQSEAAIDQDGFGDVYRARERLTGDGVAIRERVPAFVDNPETVQRFILEAGAILRLTHRPIVRTHGVFEDRGTCCLAMGYLARGLLHDEGYQMSLTDAPTWSGSRFCGARSRGYAVIEKPSELPGMGGWGHLPVSTSCAAAVRAYGGLECRH